MPRILLHALLVLALLGAAAPATAQSYGDFVLSGDFALYENGQELEQAEIYRATQAAGVLVRDSSLPAPVLIAPGSQRVETINVMKLSKAGEDTLRLLPGATLEPQGGFQIKGQDIEFTVDGRTLTLGPKPPLLGSKDAEDLKEYSYLYVKRSRDYTPDPGALSRLESLSQPVKVRVFFGSWCPHCQRTVPHAVRLAEELEGSQVDFEFYGLPQGFGNEPEAKKNNVTAVPTGIVYVNGKEAGRISNEEWAHPERAIQRIVSSS